MWDSLKDALIKIILVGVMAVVFSVIMYFSPPWVDEIVKQLASKMMIPIVEVVNPNDIKDG